MNFWAFFTAFFLDRATKAAVERKLCEGETKTVIPGRLYFSRIRNYGFANGFLSGRPQLVAHITLVTLALSAQYALRELRGASAGAKLGYSLMLGGGASNMADRLKDGYVTDFIRFKQGKALVYNIADFFIFAGMAIFALFSTKQTQQKH